MKIRTLSVLFLTLLVMTGCRRYEATVTGAYGEANLSAQVVMANGSSPAGIEVSGGGMVTTLGEDGRFVMTGIRQNVDLHFRRGTDGIDAQLNVTPHSDLVIELTGNKASGRRRGATPGKREFEGVIREAAADSILLYTSHKEEVRITIDELTIIRKGNTTYTAAELKADWRVHVKAVLKEDVLTALEIKVQNTGEDDDEDGEDEGQTMTANGPVTANDGSTLTVLSQSKGEVTVQTNADTIIKRQGERITAAEILVGDEINSMGTRVDDHTLLARQIEVRGKSKKK